MFCPRSVWSCGSARGGSSAETVAVFVLRGVVVYSGTHRYVTERLERQCSNCSDSCSREACSGEQAYDHLM